MNRLLSILTLGGALLAAQPMPVAAFAPLPPGLAAPSRAAAVAAQRPAGLAVLPMQASEQVKPAAATGAQPGAPAQTGTSAPLTATAGITGTAAPTGTGLLTATAAVTATGTLSAPAAGPATGPATGAVTGTLTGTPAITATVGVTEAAGVAATGAQTATAATAPAAALDPAQDAAYAGVLEGTIIANRTENNVRFFVEGQTYELAPLRALGLPLPRATGVLNLFNCDAAQSESDAGCFWDPYLLKQDGFYEVVLGAEAGTAVNLSLREAGAPPANQIWVQNRTGARTAVVVNNTITEIAPATVQQFAVEGAGPVVVHLRNCITQGQQTACEWAPQGVDPGYYYALVELRTEGANGTTLVTNKLEGVVASSGQVVEQPAQASCALRVPTLNVRSGPGLEFPIIAKVRGTGDQPGSVVVVGFDASKQWMQVSDRVAQGGWVTSNPDFIICTGDLAALPVQGGAGAGVAATAATTPTEGTAAADSAAAAATADTAATDTAATDTAATDTAATDTAATDTAATDAGATDTGVADGATAETAGGEAAPAEGAGGDAGEAAPTETPAAAALPAGLARLVVTNSFEQVMRFTLDQKYRVETNNLGGEWDLQPGEALSILIYPGMIPFTASTPWRGLSGNAAIQVDKDTEVPLWLRFVPDPDGSGNWILQWQ